MYLDVDVELVGCGKKKMMHKKTGNRRKTTVAVCCWLGIILMTAPTRHVLLSRVWFVKLK
jgi:hypothetical protein